MVHMLVSLLIRQLKLIIQNFRVINSETAVFASLADDFVDQIEFVFSYIGIFILLHDQLASSFIFAIVEIEI